MPTLTADRLQDLTITIFERMGAPAEHARLVAEHLVAANLAGHDSHGVIRVPQYVDAIDAGNLKPGGSMQIVERLPAGAVVEGQGGFGQVIGHAAMQLAIELAQATGVAAVGVRNCYHTGRIGTYTEVAAAAGMVGIAVVNTGGAGQAVAPFGGLAPRLSTNPISISAPSSGPFPFVMDMASSIAPEGKVRTYHQAGKPLPAGWIIDKDGNPSTDTADFYGGGALLPMGGPVAHKGYALSFMIDVLAGALTGAGNCTTRPAVLKDGMLAIALDVKRFAPLAEFNERVSESAAHMKTSPVAPGFEQVLVPGEREYLSRQRRLREGVAIEPTLWDLLEKICRRLEIALPAAA